MISYSTYLTLIMITPFLYFQTCYQLWFYKGIYRSIWNMTIHNEMHLVKSYSSIQFLIISLTQQLTPYFHTCHTSNNYHFHICIHNEMHWVKSYPSIQFLIISLTQQLTSYFYTCHTSNKFHFHICLISIIIRICPYLLE